jgi:hypothetical protein
MVAEFSSTTAETMMSPGRIKLGKLIRTATALAIPIFASFQMYLLASDPQEPPATKTPSLDMSVINWTILDNRQYLPQLKKMRESEAAFLKSKEWKDGYLQLRGTLLSYVGSYQEALADFDRAGRQATGQAKPDALQGFERYDALEAILELADKRQVIMINEAHHVPLHRTLTTQLLAGLYRKGFRYFAAETLASTDEKLQQRGYPTLQTGFYTMEPMYAELVRTALRLGYRVIPYEADFSPSPSGADDPVAAQNEREEGQAKNLKERILAKDPSAKILVHAGYSHIIKQPESWSFGAKKKRRSSPHGKQIQDPDRHRSALCRSGHDDRTQQSRCRERLLQTGHRARPGQRQAGRAA